MQPIMAGIISLLVVTTPVAPISPLLATSSHEVVLSQVNYSLLDRYSNSYVNNVFSDNILLTLAYMNGTVKEGEPFSWDQVRAPFTYRLEIAAGETFAFHDRVEPAYLDKPIVTTKAHFNSTEGFKSDGYLVGDGVCHLASFIKVAANKAGLVVEAPTRHDFAAIADVDKADGVAIYYDPDAVGSSQKQNLYVTNNRPNPIVIEFKHRDSALDITVEEVVS